jgi:hypothetical protein
MSVSSSPMVVEEAGGSGVGDEMESLRARGANGCTSRVGGAQHTRRRRGRMRDLDASEN